MIIAQPAETITANAVAPPGLVGTIATRILSPDGTLAVGGDRSTAGIVEIQDGDPPAGTGFYVLERAAPASEGRYTLLWDLGTLSAQTIAADEILVLVQGVPGAEGDYVPTVAEVATLVRARTKNDDGDELGTFTAATRPTDGEVAAMITLAANDTADAVGAADLTALPSAARLVICLQVACWIEASYFPEQLKDNQSAYAQYDALRREKLTELFPVQIA